MKAPDFLRRAAQHIEDRAAARDKPEGERSMGRCVAAFNAITGHALTERDGWLFMVALKMARACNTLGLNVALPCHVPDARITQTTSPDSMDKKPPSKTIIT